MAKDKPSKNPPEETPASELLKNFLQKNKLVIVIDKRNNYVEEADGVLLTQVEGPRVQVFYQEDLNKAREQAQQDLNLPN